jgi:tRNA modification GTPase
MDNSTRAQTIYALSSGHGRAGVAVIRVSGPSADVALQALAGRLPPYRQAALMTLRRPFDGEVLDRALCLRFPAGGSFTGEASVELQVHGGRAVVQAVLQTLSALPDLRPAEAGEFTRRALENGKLDLTQVEALGDLINAETEQQRRQALHGFKGALGDKVRDWRELLLEAKAIVAAEIDFSDEGDVGENASAGIDSLLQRLEASLQSVLENADLGRIVAEGFRVVITGPPNVGKSTLLNALAGSDVAIVTEHAGTTRDVLEVRLDIGGYPVVLLDTAGVRRPALDPVERIGIARGLGVAAGADLLLVLDDGQHGFGVDEALEGLRSIRIRTKSDAKSAARRVGAEDTQADLMLSALTGEGMDSLVERLRGAIVQFDGGEPPVLTRERQRMGVVRALNACVAARGSAVLGIEFVDDQLRRADEALAEIIGMIHVEEVLGAIFSRFCVGK